MERGAFVVEGPQAVISASLRGHIQELYLTAEAADAHPQVLRAAGEMSSRVALMTDAVARAMSETSNPQGILAVCSLVGRTWLSFTDVVAEAGQVDGRSRPPLVVVLDRISDPGNAGTIIRTADAAGASAVVFTSGSVDPHNGKCVRATAGSIFHIPVYTDATAEQVVHEARQAGVVCLVADSEGEILLGSDQARQVLDRGAVWIFGNEAHGVDPATAAMVDARIAIPMRGGAESLNLAAAAAICLYASAL